MICFELVSDRFSLLTRVLKRAVGIWDKVLVTPPSGAKAATNICDHRINSCANKYLLMQQLFIADK